MVLEEELSSKDEIKIAPDLSVTSDAITLTVASNRDQSPVSSNPSIADRTMEEAASNANKWVFTSFVSKERASYTQCTHRTIGSIQMEPTNVRFTFGWHSITSGLSHNFP